MDNRSLSYNSLHFIQILLDCYMIESLMSQGGMPFLKTEIVQIHIKLTLI